MDSYVQSVIYKCFVGTYLSVIYIPLSLQDHPQEEVLSHSPVPADHLYNLAPPLALPPVSPQNGSGSLDHLHLCCDFQQRFSILTRFVTNINIVQYFFLYCHITNKVICIHFYTVFTVHLYIPYIRCVYICIASLSLLAMLHILYMPIGFLVPCNWPDQVIANEDVICIC